MSAKSLILESSFESLPIRTDLVGALNPTDLIVFFHGCCGTVYDHVPSTYVELSSHLKKHKGVAVLLVETARRVRKVDFAPDKLNFSEFTQAAFAHKTYQDEVADYDRVIDRILDDYRQQKSHPRLHFIGFSLGGLIATELSQKYHPATLILCGSATEFQVEPTLPLIGSGLGKDTQANILSAAETYVGKVALVRGGADDTALSDTAWQLFSAFTQATERSLTEWAGVDHRFKLQNGVSNPKLVTKLTTFIERQTNL